jgi:hypothetical protein
MVVWQYLTRLKGFVEGKHFSIIIWSFNDKEKKSFITFKPGGTTMTTITEYEVGNPENIL